jgi:methionine biosynthesis protein MetW
LTVYGELVARHGLAESHRLILESVAEGSRVLDVGCAEGYLAAALQERGCAVVGIEGNAEAAAKAPVEVVVGDVEDPRVRERVTERFDVAIFGDVLEHLRDPLAVLRWAPADRAVVSLPNVAHWTARRALLRGRWPQEDHGLFDRTHLHFFTRATARGLVERAGFAVEREAFAGAPLPLESRLPPLGRLRPALVRRRPELFALQVVLQAAR